MSKIISVLFFILSLQIDNAFSASYPKIVDLYFVNSAIDPNEIGAPPAADSEEKQKEILQIIEMQKGVKPEDIDMANFEYGIASEKFIKAVEPELTREKYPALYNLLTRSRVTAHETKDRIKDYWMSKHPYQVSDKIKILVKEDKFSSYPSGHATKCYTLARIMGILLPEQKDEFYAKADSMSQLRVLVGEHFPSDIEAGRRLSEIIVDKMLTIPQFKKDLEKAKIELKKYHPSK